eukprot:1159945-Pelagomonas_calceolata.AAC.5
MTTPAGPLGAAVLPPEPPPRQPAAVLALLPQSLLLALISPTPGLIPTQPAEYAPTVFLTISPAHPLCFCLPCVCTCACIQGLRGRGLWLGGARHGQRTQRGWTG